jgi:uncharacterized protein (TIGR03435 family)
MRLSKESSNHSQLPFFTVIALLVATATPLKAQSAAVPEWQTVAGGKMAFEVASIKQNKTGLPPSGNTPSSNFPLDSGSVYPPTGGLFSATNFPVTTLLAFAYKMTNYQARSLASELPKWAATDRFDIQARTGGNPTKDQMRLMMQALLADRFKLSIHQETRHLPVFATVLVKPEKTRPQLRRHPENEPCSATSPPTAETGWAPTPPPMTSSGYPTICGVVLGLQSSVPGRARLGVSNVSMSFLANVLAGLGNEINRPVFDGTGLSGNFDFTVEWTPLITVPIPAGAAFQPDPTGPTLLEALQEQLGLKLVPQTGPVDILVIDHVEKPSEN